MLCPDGYTCDGTLCRATSSSQTCNQIIGDANRDSSGGADARVDGAPGVDTDGDMVNDDVDNCIDDLNANQADEDGDNKGDVCDPCPMFNNPQADLDGDGDTIGDGCDPRPTAMGDVVVLFEGFHDAVQPPNTTELGAWSYTGGRAAGVLGTNDLHWNLALVPGQDKFTIRTQFQVLDTTIAVVNQFSGVGTVDSIPPGGFPGVGCGVGIGNNQANGLHAFTVGNNADSTFLTGMIPPISINDTVQLLHLRVDTNASSLGCEVGTIDLNPSTISTSPVQGIALHTRNWKAAFDYIFVVQVP